MESFWIFTTKFFRFSLYSLYTFYLSCAERPLDSLEIEKCSFKFQFYVLHIHTNTLAAVYIYAFRCMHWKFDTFCGHYWCEWWASFIQCENDKKRKQEQIHFRILLRKTILISSIAVSDSFACVFLKKRREWKSFCLLWANLQIERCKAVNKYAQMTLIFNLAVAAFMSAQETSESAFGRLIHLQQKNGTFRGNYSLLVV